MTRCRKNFFYFPVLYSVLSLVGIFLLFWKIIGKEKPRVMEVNWYKEGFYNFHPPARQYLLVTFTGDTTTDRVKLDFGQIYIREMLKKKDFVHGIDFHFSETARYAMFVEVLDIWNMEGAPFCFPSDSGIKIFFDTGLSYKPNIKNGPISKCGGCR